MSATGGPVEVRTAAARPRALRGEVRVPGDKSISHRALILSALGAGTSIVRGLNTGGDVAGLTDLLTSLGAACRTDERKRQVEVDGCGWDGLVEPEEVLDVGNSGTTIRLLTAVCAGIDGVSVLTGDASVRRRPMLRVVAPLRRMGAIIDGRRHADRAPLVVRGGALTGIDFESPVPSAQLKTAVLLAGLRASGVTSIREPLPSRDHTERMLTARGVSVMRSGGAVSVPGEVRLPAFDQAIPGDLSSAMFLVVAALLLPGSELTIRDLGLNPTRTAALDVLRAMGGDIETTVETDMGGEPAGSLTVRASDLSGVVLDPTTVPGLIDEIPALAVAAAVADGRTVISGAAELRVKESDRIAALAVTLGALGADVRPAADGLEINGPTTFRGGEVDSRGDHRIAMALSIAGMVANENVKVRGWSSVATSFPEFLEILGEAQAGK